MALFKKFGTFAAIGLLAASTIALARDSREPEVPGAQPVARRLSQQQYRNIIADVFGPNIKVGGRFEPDTREEGLIAIGLSRVSVTASGLEEYDKIGRNIAAQVMAEPHRSALMPCKPAAANDADDACARQFLADAGRLLYRRPLTDAELGARVKLAADSARKLRNFHNGLAAGLATLLSSPDFLFRSEVAAPDSERLDAYSTASRLSFFLWNSAPDLELLDAAARGDLATEKGLGKQVERMLASPRLANGVRALFTDMFSFDQFETLSKDRVLFPKYNFKVARDAQEQTLRTIVDLLLTQKGDYRDLFTTRKTFLTPMLASTYAVPFVATNDGWQPYEFGKGDPRGGILSQVSFVALHAHPGRSSPTLRGKALRELILCQAVPLPPGNVNFTLVQDINNPTFKTARARLTAHATDPLCTGCHKIIDPIGLALENFDSSGGYRETENGSEIDTSGELNGRKFTDAAGLAQAVHDDPATPACVVKRAYSYGMGRPSMKEEGALLSYFEKEFASRGYRLPDLLRRIATSDAFYRVAPLNRQAAITPAIQMASEIVPPIRNSCTGRGPSAPGISDRKAVRDSNVC